MMMMMMVMMIMMMTMVSAGNFLRPGWCNGHYGGDERGIIRLIRRRGNGGYGVMTMRREIMMRMKIMMITKVMLIFFRKKRGMRNSDIVMVAMLDKWIYG